MKNFRAPKRLGRDDAGVAAVEFAMIAPVFFAMLISIIDVSRYMWTLNTLQYAVDEAVRAGVVQQLSQTETEARAKEAMAGLDLKAIHVLATPDASSLTVEADTDYVFMFPISIFQATTKIAVKSEMPL